jgi:hypothetical protein
MFGNSIGVCPRSLFLADDEPSAGFIMFYLPILATK